MNLAPVPFPYRTAFNFRFDHDAFIADESGRRLVDFRQSNIHVVSYSRPVDRILSLAELQPLA